MRLFNMNPDHDTLRRMATIHEELVKIAENPKDFQLVKRTIKPLAEHLGEHIDKMGEHFKDAEQLDELIEKIQGEKQ